ncbi:MAG: DUF3703 domain-containing protein [Woeseiaceae bacterium]
MSTERHLAFDQEIALGRKFIAAGDLDRAFRHLERAHVIGQTVRIVLGVVGSAVGVVPVGNTGGTDISMFKRLPIAPELQKIIDGDSSPGPKGS